VKSAKAGEGGYALVAAVACIAVFAGAALAITSATRSSIAAGGGEINAARAGLAAQSGLASALHGLAQGDEAMLGLIAGGQAQIDVDGAQVAVRIADERGKIPLNFLEDAAVERMLSGAGLGGAALAIARDSLLDWIDDDDLARADGAEAPFYNARQIAPRNGNLATIDELGAVRGFTPELVARLRPFVTAQMGTIPFDRRYASPQAIAAMGDGGDGSPEAIEAAREAAGQRTALQFIDKKALVGRPITLSADATIPQGGHAHSQWVVMITGRSSHPWVILQAD